MDEKTVKCAIAHFNKKITDYQMFVNKEIRNQDEQIKSAENYLINTLDSQNKRIDEFVSQPGPQGPEGPQGPKGDPYILTDQDKAEIKQYVDDAVASSGGTGGVSQEYVDGIVAEAGKSIAYITENYATKEYVDNNYVSTTMLGEMVGVFAEDYATKEYVNGLIGDIETLLGGI